MDNLKTRLNQDLVVSCPIEGTWLVNDRVLGTGKGSASGVAVYYYSKANYWQCEQHGASIGSTRDDCVHIKAVELYRSSNG